MGNDIEAQEADMRQLRTDHELELEGLLHEVERATIHGDIKGVVAAKGRLRASLRPLLDAAYGPLKAPAGPLCYPFDEVARVDPARRWREYPDGPRWVTDAEWRAR